jgi:beta-lactamase superfamily II metal-dependent hydrolase
MRRLLLALCLMPATLFAQAADVPGSVLSAWRPGTLDIHQITTGRGNAAFLQLPDGTTLLVDAGAAPDGIPYSDPRPNPTKRPGEWIASYINHVLPAGAPRRIDYALSTHIHIDHMGGFSDVEKALPIGTLIDRGWPSYDYPEPIPPPLMSIYKTFVDAARSRGAAVERARPGRADQIVLRHANPSATPFEIRIVAANGEVWTGSGTATEQRFPPQGPSTRPDDRPSENDCSVALRLKYGAFDFYTGGDMTGISDPGTAAWHDMETPIGRAIGATDVRVMNHHGSISPDNPAFLAATRSRVVIIPAWSPTHPAPDALKRALAPTSYPGPRDVFVNILREPTAHTIGDRVKQLKSTHGHIVVRVDPDGRHYRVVILDDEHEDAKVVAVHGPYESMP